MSNFNQKIKFGLWTLTPVIFGVLLASFIFPEFNTEQYLATPQPADVHTATVTEPDFVTLTFGGDIMMDRGVRSSVNKNLGGDYSKLFENLEILKDSDILFANLEGPASDQGKNVGSKYSFRMDPAVIPVLKNAGVDVLSVANNHVGDWTESAFIDTLSRLKDAEILYAGGGNNKSEAEAPAIIEKNGIKIGFLAFSDKGPNWMEATEQSAGLLIARSTTLGEIVKKASSQADFLIVSFHFGEEYQTTHDARQEKLAHLAVDHGAKLVIGHHPHVVQDFEVYKESFIAYSLGNFIFDQSWSEPTMQGALLNIKLSKNGEMEKRIDSFKLNKFFQPSEIVEDVTEKIEFHQ